MISNVDPAPSPALTDAQAERFADVYRYLWRKEPPEGWRGRVDTADLHHLERMADNDYSKGRRLSEGR